MFFSNLAKIDDVIRFYLECLKIRDRLPQDAQIYIIDTVKTKFENYLLAIDWSRIFATNQKLEIMYSSEDVEMFHF